jgi:DnaJ-class molecular chaperone
MDDQLDDELIDCPVCDGLGYIPCDDGSEIQCAQCDGTGKVPAIKV